MSPIYSFQNQSLQTPGLKSGDGSLILAVRREGSLRDFVLVKIRPDGGTPDTFDPQTGRTISSAGGDGTSAALSDPTAGFGSLETSGASAPVTDHGGLFSDVPGMSVFNPDGKRDVFDGGAGAL
jgi:hypothetical protein